MKINNAIIFAAGKGKRMRPLTNYVPKPLIKIHDIPLIELNIKYLNEIGITNITIVVGYLSQQFNYLKKKYNVSIIKNDLYKTTNNISSLIASQHIFNNTLYVEGDIYLKENQFIKAQQIIQQQKQSVMFSSFNTEIRSEWVFNTDNNDFVTSHALDDDALNKNIWSGIAFISYQMSEEIRQKSQKFFKNNKQEYFETFLWTLDNKFKHVSLGKNAVKEIDSFDDLLKVDISYLSHHKTALFTPGPVNNYPEIEEILSEHVVHHRSQLFSYYFEKTKENLKTIFSTKEGEIILITCSATGLMETAIINLVNRNDKVLVLSCGDFGNRMKQILDVHNLKYNSLDFEYYQPINPNALEKHLAKNKYDVVIVTHHETSTGVLNNLEKIAKIVKQNNALLISDTVSSVINEELLFDDWNLDVAFATSGKGFSIMPGLSIMCLSKDAVEKINNNANIPTFYFDLKKYIEFSKKQSSTPFTPASAILMGLKASTEIIINQTLESIRETKKEIYWYLKNELLKLGFTDVVDENYITTSLLVMNTPEGVDALKIRNYIEYWKHIYFEVGRLDKRTTQVRIGISNTISLENAQELMSAINKYISLTKK